MIWASCALLPIMAAARRGPRPVDRAEARAAEASTGAGADHTKARQSRNGSFARPPGRPCVVPAPGDPDDAPLASGRRHAAGTSSRPPRPRTADPARSATAPSAARVIAVADASMWPVAVSGPFSGGTTGAQVMPGVRGAHARHHLPNGFDHHLRLILVDVVAALRGHGEARVRRQG